VKEYWPRLADICKRHGVLLIADEVMTSFGRTGRRFGVDHWEVSPDILVGGKGLTGGYLPMGMIAVQERLVQECEAKGAEFMFYTYSAHPTACAVADRVLEIMEREHLVERSAELGARLGASLKEELSGHPMVGDIRGAGLFWGVEMVRDRASREPYPAAMKVASKTVAAGLKHGLFVYPATGMARPGGDAVMVAPPFVIGNGEIEYIVRTLRATLDDVYTGLQ
jgi:adenosylmethionine-8-amino-7-oxononanoate aminotransferase